MVKVILKARAGSVLNNVKLVPGPNTISDDDFEAMQKSPKFAKLQSRLEISKGAMAVKQEVKSEDSNALLQNAVVALSEELSVLRAKVSEIDYKLLEQDEILQEYFKKSMEEEPKEKEPEQKDSGEKLSKKASKQ